MEALLARLARETVPVNSELNKWFLTPGCAPMVLQTSLPDRWVSIRSPRRRRHDSRQRTEVLTRVLVVKNTHKSNKKESCPCLLCTHRTTSKFGPLSSRTPTAPKINQDRSSIVCDRLGDFSIRFHLRSPRASRNSSARAPWPGSAPERLSGCTGPRPPAVAADSRRGAPPFTARSRPHRRLPSAGGELHM